MNNKLLALVVSAAFVALVGCPGNSEEASTDVGMNQGNRTQNGVATDPGDGTTNTTGGSINSAVAEERFLELVNEARGSARMCGDAEYPAVGAVVWSERIEAAALRHSVDMAGRGVLTHTGATGSNVGDRLTAEGYRWSSAAENIASGYVTPEGVVQGWLGSVGHCITLMNGDYTEMAVSSADSSDENPVRYWAQVFARPNR